MTRQSCVPKIIAVAAATLLGVSGVALSTAASVAAPVAPLATNVCDANPMGASIPVGASNGYTIFTTGDAVFANSETEGSIAVGGTATFWDDRGNPNRQYPILHSIAGNADYGLPVIDGVDSRVLLNRYSPGVASPATNTSTGKIVQVSSRGLPSGASGDGIVKIVNSDTPSYIFGSSFDSSGTSYLPAGGGNQSAQLDSRVQAWNAGAGAASFETVGDFTDYFAADAGTALLNSADIDWLTPTITGAQPGAEAKVTLDLSGPNRIALGDLGGATKYTFQDNIVYSPCAPLVIKVATSDIVGGVLSLPSLAYAGLSAAGEGISYVLFDLSSISGEVTVTSPNEPVRGAIYAPQAHIIFPPEAQGGREYEGQLIASQLTALQGGKEIHTNLFKGRLAAAPVAPGVVGGFSLEKLLNVPAGMSADDAEFNFDVTVGGVGRLVTLAAGEKETVTGLALGTVVTIRERVTAIPGAIFDGVEYAVDATPAAQSNGLISFAITAATTAVVASNSYTLDPAVGGGTGGGNGTGTGGGGSGGGQLPTLALDSSADGLPVTGSAGVLAAVLGALLLLGTGLAAIVVRRRLS